MHQRTENITTWNYPWWFFSLARFNPGGPAWYGEENRLTPTKYLTTSFLTIVSVAITFLLVLCIVLPIIKNKLYTIIAAVNTLLIGLTIALCLICPEWIGGHGEVQSPSDYHNAEVITPKMLPFLSESLKKYQYLYCSWYMDFPRLYEYHLGIHIGLSYFNVTLRSIDRNFYVHLNGSLTLRDDDDLAPEIFYNERVRMYNPSNLKGVMKKSLEHGLPIPILTVYECLLSATEGFDWSHRILEAGYHVYLILVFALVGWFLACLLVAAIPRYGSYAFIAVGILMMFASVVYFYWAAVAEALPCIVIGDSYLELEYGVCFWASLGIGLWSVIYGFILAVYDVIHPDKFLTIFDLDYDSKSALARANRCSFVVSNEEEDEYYGGDKPFSF